MWLQLMRQKEQLAICKFAATAKRSGESCSLSWLSCDYGCCCFDQYTSQYVAEQLQQRVLELLLCNLNAEDKVSAAVAPAAPVNMLVSSYNKESLRPLLRVQTAEQEAPAAAVAPAAPTNIIPIFRWALRALVRLQLLLHASSLHVLSRWISCKQ